MYYFADVAASQKFHLLNNWLKKHGICRMSWSDMKLLMRHTTLVSIPKGSILMPQGKMVQHLYFIHSGIIRLFRKVQAEDKTMDFVPEREFASTIIYILNQELSPCGLEVLTNVEALYWSRETVLYLRGKITSNVSYEIKSVEEYSGTDTVAGAGANYTVHGNLTMLGKPLEVSFPARITLTGATMQVSAKVKVDRTRWGMNYAADPTLPDDKYILPQMEIELSLKGVKK